MGRFAILAFVFVLLCLQPGQGSARILHGENQEFMEKVRAVLQSLPKGPVPPSGPSSCTNIPGMGNQGGPGCPPYVNEMNFAGGALPRAGGAYPRHRLLAAAGVASSQN